MNWFLSPWHTQTISLLRYHWIDCWSALKTCFGFSPLSVGIRRSSHFFVPTVEYFLSLLVIQTSPGVLLLPCCPPQAGAVVLRLLSVIDCVSGSMGHTQTEPLITAEQWRTWERRRRLDGTLCHLSAGHTGEPKDESSGAKLRFRARPPYIISLHTTASTAHVVQLPRPKSHWKRLYFLENKRNKSPAKTSGAPYFCWVSYQQSLSKLPYSSSTMSVRDPA